MLKSNDELDQIHCANPTVHKTKTVSKAEEALKMPLFLSETYLQMYDRSYENMTKENTDQSNIDARTSVDDRKKAKGVSKMYRQAWLQDKMQAQNERRKQQRGNKMT